MRSFAERLSDVLKESGLTQHTVVEMAGMSQHSISTYARGIRVPDEGKKKKIALALGKPEAFFLSPEGSRKESDEGKCHWRWAETFD